MARQKPAPDYTDGQWHRLHPLTPVLQGGLFVAAIIGVVFASFWDALVTQLTALIVLQEVPEQANQEIPSLPPLGELALIALVGVGGIVAGAAWLWLSWFLHTFRIGDEVIEVRSGVFSRTYRSARRDRINSVSIWRQLVPRLLGLAKVEFQAAGSDANVTLAYLPDEVAKNLRRVVLDTSPLADTASDGEDEGSQGVSEGVSEADELDVLGSEEGEVRVLVPLGRLAWSLVVSIETVLFVTVLLVIVVGFAITGDREWWLGAIPALLVWGAGIFRGWTRANRFRLAVLGDSIRVSYGLLSTTAETLPTRRVHSLTLSQPWPWRLFGWWRVDARRAVTPGQSSKEGPSHTMLLPVGTLEDARAVLDLFLASSLGQAGLDAIEVAIDHSVDKIDPSGLDRFAALHASPLARFRLVFSQPSHSIGLVNDTVWLRTGFFIRRLTIVPFERIQSTGTFRGPWHLILGLTGLQVHLVSGPGLSSLAGFPTPEAQYFAGQLADSTIDAVGHARTRDLLAGVAA